MLAKPTTQKAAHPGGLSFYLPNVLRRDVREERHVAGALDGLAYLALLGGRDARALLPHNLGVWRGKLLEIRDVLVVHVLLDLYFFALGLVGHGLGIKKGCPQG